MDRLKAEHGDAKGEFMVKGSRNLCLYPNVYLMDQFSTQIRHFRPISADKTEVTIYCIAPKGESAEARTWRIRQYEDFFNASGMATPDDLEEFRSCQKTFLATAAPWNDMSRGAQHWLNGADDVAKSLDMPNVLSSGVKNEDEGLYPVQHGYWREAILAGMEREGAAAGAAGKSNGTAAKSNGSATRKPRAASARTGK